jgi:hypothetical protein
MMARSMTRGTTRTAALIAAALTTLAAALAPGCRDRDPNTPIVLIGTPGGLGGSAVPVTFVLRNQDTTNASIEPLFSTDGGFSYRAATRGAGGEGTAALQASPGGTAHIFSWNALLDLGPGRHANVLFRIVPRISGRVGTIAETFPFTLDNTDLFVRAPDLALARRGAGAAPLPEDGAIVAGGGGLSGTSEAFDPLAEAPETRDALATAREDAPAGTALVEGPGGPEASPVIAGGSGAGGAAVTSVERYDPGEDDWVDAGVDVGARSGHTVTRLSDGRLLVAGGGPASDLVLDLRDPSAPSATLVGAGAGRSAHAATLLPDGRVLVSGGTGPGGPLASTLVFSPETLAYQAGPTLLEPRSAHAAALSGARVLVAGGRDSAGAPTSTAELADVTLTAFARTGSLTAAREGHTATGLSDGTVLVAGGAGAAGTSLSSAERFVAAVGVFVPTRGGLSVPRRGHQATPFGAGRVLITGGGTDAVEVYHPQSLSGAQVFDPIPARARGRAEHAVTALADGRALVTGGTDGIVVGSTPAALRSAEVFDPRARPDARLAPLAATLTAARRRHTATLLSDGRVLIAGGLGEGGAALASLEVFSPSGATFGALAAALPDGLSEHAAVRLDDGRVLVTGGRPAGGGASAAAYLVDASGAGSVATAASPLVTARRRHTATLLPDGRVLLAGGVDASGAALDGAEVFDPSGETFTAAAGTLGAARFGHAALRLTDGSVIVAGGRPGTESAPGAPTPSVLRFDPASTTFTALAPLRTGRAEMAAFTDSVGRAVFAGGIVGTAPAGAPDAAAPLTASAEIYTATGGGSSAATADPDISVPRRGIGAATLSGGTAVLLGGRRADATTTAGGERYLP